LPFNLIWAHGCSAPFGGAAIVPMFVLMAFLSRYTGGLTGRYGPRLPLVVGPTIAAVGFTLSVVCWFKRKGSIVSQENPIHDRLQACFGD
jgi:hypothetical protein